MLATPIAGAVQILAVDPLGWLLVSCDDYDAFRTLPVAVTYEGRPYARRGWNSDRNLAYYEGGLKGVALS